MNDLVVKANNLIEGIIDMSHNEYKLTLFLISRINRKDKEFTTQKITVKEFAKLINCENKIYTYMKNMAESMISKKIKIIYGGSNMLNINWFSYTDYKADKGIVEFAFNSKLAPFLLNINIAYTKYFLNNVRLMKSKHSIRIYELLKQYEKIGYRKITLEDLKACLDIEPTKYRSYYTFKKTVLLKAQQELKKYSDMYFEFEEIKEGRRIVVINFIIKSNNNKSIIDNTEEEQLNVEDSKESNPNNTLVTKFNTKYNANIGCKWIDKLVENKGFECVKQCIDEFKHYVSSANEVEKVFFKFTMKYGTEKAYTKTSSYNNSKPIQATNYKQREYDDDFFNSLYDNVTLVKGD